MQDERFEREPAPSDATTSPGTETSTDASTAGPGRGTTGPESTTTDVAVAEPAASATPRTPETADRTAADVDEAAASLPDDGEESEFQRRSRRVAPLTLVAVDARFSSQAVV